MNRSLLLALIGLSLAGNAWFLIARAREPAPSSTRDGTAESGASTHRATGAAPNAATSAAAPAAAKSAAGDAAAPRGLTWHAPTTDDEFRAFANDLRAAGFPPRMIYSIVSELYEQRRRAESPAAKLPFWQRRAVQKEMQEYNRATAKGLEAILGPEARRSVRIDDVARARQYGPLADAKIDAIAAIERDYEEMRSDMTPNPDGGFFSNDEWSARQQQRNLLKAEMRTDLEKILTPAELADYEMRNSDIGRSVAHAVREVKLSAPEFAALYNARRAFDSANPPLSGRITAEQWQQRQDAELAYFDQVRALLPDDRFYRYLEGSDPTYRNLSALTRQFPSVTPAVSYQALQLQRAVERERNTLFQSGTANTFESVQAAYAGWNARLESLLGAEAAAAYRKTMPGRTFVAPTPRAGSRTVPPRG